MTFATFICNLRNEGCIGMEQKGPRHPWRSLGRRSKEREESAGTTVARP
jgi:hypothetical protein